MRFLVDWWMWLDEGTRECLQAVATFFLGLFGLMALICALFNFIDWLPWPEFLRHPSEVQP